MCLLSEVPEPLMRRVMAFHAEKAQVIDVEAPLPPLIRLYRDDVVDVGSRLAALLAFVTRVDHLLLGGHFPFPRLVEAAVLGVFGVETLGVFALVVALLLASGGFLRPVLGVALLAERRAVADGFEALAPRAQLEAQISQGTRP